jgi:NADPH-dependent 2,4-dienoyl-CoA reductase/sulfur reductase-like enzyme
MECRTVTLERTRQTAIDGASIDTIGSLWQASTPSLPELAPAKGSKSTDVVIIGAGFTGLSAALELRRTGIAVVVLEAVEPGWGLRGEIVAWSFRP